MMVHLQEPPNERNRHTQKHLVFLVIGVLLIIGGTVVWIMNIAGLVTGPWSNIFGIIVAVLGVVIPLLEVHRQSPARNPPEPVPLSTHQTRILDIPLEEFNLGVNKRRGALIVKVRRRLRRSTINLSRGFDNDDSDVHVASSVVLRRVDGSRTYVAIFPGLESGNYTVAVHPTGQKRNVTITPDRPTEIDWR